PLIKPAKFSPGAVRNVEIIDRDKSASPLTCGRSARGSGRPQTISNAEHTAKGRKPSEPTKLRISGPSARPPDKTEANMPKIVPRRDPDARLLLHDSLTTH